MTDAQRNRTLGLVMSGLSLMVCGVGGFIVQKAAAPVRDVADADALRALEPPVFVRMTVTPRPESVGTVIEGASTDFLLLTDEGVLLYVGGGTDMGRRLSHRLSDPAAIALLRQPATVEGSCYAVGDVPRLTSTLPGYLVEDYAEEHHLPEGTRVIEVDHGPGSVAMIGVLPVGCCSLPLLALGLYALVRSRQR